MNKNLGQLDDETAQALVRGKMGYKFHKEIREVYDKYVTEHEKELDQQIKILQEHRKKEKIDGQ